MTKPANEIVLTDIDLDFIEQSNDVKALRHMLRLLEEDGCYSYLIDAAKSRLQSVSKKHVGTIDATPAEAQQSRALLDDWTSELKRLDRDLSKSSSSAHRREQPSGYAPVITRELPPTRNTVQVHAAPALSPQEARIERETREQQERSKAEAAGAVPAHQKAMTDLLNGTSQGEGKSKPQSADADANANAAKQAELVELQQQLEQVRVSKKLMASVPSSAAMSAAQLKDRGNEALKANELLDASICYTRSLLIDHFSTAAAIVYANRGLAFHRSKNFEAAENEFSSALQCDPNYVKAMSRRSVTRLARGRFALGLQDAHAALRILPHDAELVRVRADAERRLRESEGDGASAIIQSIFSGTYVEPEPKASYRRVPIAEDSDDDEPAPGKNTSTAAPQTRSQALPTQQSSKPISAQLSGPVKRMVIEEVSDDEDEQPAKPVAAKQSSSAAESLRAAHTTAQEHFSNGQYELVITGLRRALDGLPTKDLEPELRFVAGAALETRANALAQSAQNQAAIADCSAALSLLNTLPDAFDGLFELKGKLLTRRGFSHEAEEKMHLALADLRAASALLASPQASVTSAVPLMLTASRALPRLARATLSQLTTQLQDLLTSVASIANISSVASDESQWSVSPDRASAVLQALDVARRDDFAGRLAACGSEPGAAAVGKVRALESKLRRLGELAAAALKPAAVPATASAASSGSSDATNSPAPKSVTPSKVVRPEPKTIYEFERVFQSLESRPASEFASYLLGSVPSPTLSRICKGIALKSELFSALVNVIATHIVQESSSRAFEYLQAIASSDRLTLNMKFLSAAELTGLRALLQRLDNEGYTVALLRAAFSV